MALEDLVVALIAEELSAQEFLDFLRAFFKSQNC